MSDIDSAVERLVYLLDNYAEAKRIERECVANCDYEASYHCYWQRKEAEDAATELAMKLKEIINLVVDERLGIQARKEEADDD